MGDIGSVIETSSGDCIIERNKQKITGSKGATIESMDTYVTNICVGNITFKDNTKVKVNENSRLLIDDFVFDPTNSDAGKLALKIGMGTVRYASGQIAKNNPQSVGIKTPTATIAVRGTDFSMTVDEAGQSLIVLIPSCTDDKDVKKYELEENKCKVGKIEVETLAGKVVLDQAFQATFVQSTTSLPTPPTTVSIIESKINNNLIIVKPAEVQKAIVNAGKTKEDEEEEDLESEATRRLIAKVGQSGEAIENARVIKMLEISGKAGCNPTTSVCVIWDVKDEELEQNKGKGIAYRVGGNEHYAEVKTTGFVSNTIINITQNDDIASKIIGDGGNGANIVNITQSSGVPPVQ